jgi:hypothetical protein
MSDAPASDLQLPASNLQLKDGLKPYTLGEILDRTVQIYRRNFLLFVGIAALPTLLMVLVGGGAGALLGWAGKTQSDTTSAIAGLVFLALMLIFFPVWVVIQSIANGALTITAVRMHEGEKVTIREALSAAWKRGWHYIGTQFFVYLFTAILPGFVAFGLAMLVAVLVTLAGTGGAGAGVVTGLIVVLAVVGGFAFVAYMVLAMIRLSLSFAACTGEQLGPWSALRRSFALSRGSMGRIFLFGLLVYALTMAITFVFIFLCMIPFVIVVAMMKDQGSHAQQQMIGIAFFVIYYSAIFLAQVVIKPVYSIGLTVFYFDERVRKEGYDIEWMMQRAGLVDTGVSENTTVAQPGGEG